MEWKLPSEENFKKDKPDLSEMDDYSRLYELRDLYRIRSKKAESDLKSALDIIAESAKEISDTGNLSLSDVQRVANNLTSFLTKYK